MFSAHFEKSENSRCQILFVNSKIAYINVAID